MTQRAAQTNLGERATKPRWSPHSRRRSDTPTDEALDSALETRTDPPRLGGLGICRSPSKEPPPRTETIPRPSRAIRVEATDVRVQDQSYLFPVSSTELQFKAPKWRVHRWMLAGLVAGLSPAGCLKLNLDYSYPFGAQDPRDESHPSTTGATQDLSTNTSPGGSNSIETGAGSMPEPTDTPTQSGSPTTEPGTDTNTNTSSSSTTSTTDPGLNEPGPGSRWIPMTVENPSSARSAPNGASVKLSVDHAALVVAGASLDGEDLRIYSVRGANRTQLHRVLDPESTWGRSDTAIWFKLDESLSPSQAEANVYHLVLDPNMSSPAQDPNQVFLFFDDFNTPNPSLDGWSVHNTGLGGDFDAQVTGGQLVLSARSTGNNVALTEVRTAQTVSATGLVVESSVGWDSVAGRDGCTEETLIGLWSPGDYHKRALWNRRDDEWYFVNRTSSGTIRYQLLSAQPVDGNLLRHSAYWVQNPFSMYTENNFVASLTPYLTGFTNPGDGPLHLGFTAGADGGICSRTSRVTVDWVLARSAGSVFEVQTTLRLADEFVQP